MTAFILPPAMHNPLTRRPKIAAVPTKTPPPAPRDTVPCAPPDAADWTDEPQSGERVIPQSRLDAFHAEWARLESGRRLESALDAETEDDDATAFPGGWR